MSAEFNMEKLPEYTETMKDISVLLVGGGAVGSYAGEFVGKMGIGRATVIDNDRYTAENAVKSSCIVRMPEDVGRNKAVALAERVQALMIPGGRANGIDANINRFGPMAFEQYDAVLLSLDNFAAKIYFNQIWLQLPPEKRPLLIVGGTRLEMAQSNCLDGHEACLRCLVDESWLTDFSKKSSCGDVQYVFDGKEEVPVRTTGMASCHAALLMVEQLRAYILKHPDIVNKRTCYTAYPNLEITWSTPMPRSSCPDCAKIHAPNDVVRLEGSVLERTLGEFFTEINRFFGSDEYELLVHELNFSGITHCRFILDDVCKSCGKTLPSFCAHEGRTLFSDVLCDECRKAGKIAYADSLRRDGTVLHAFAPRTCPEALLKMTLYELGYPIGAYLWTKQSGSAFDAIDGTPTYTCFTCSGDAEKMHTIHVAR